MLNMGSAMGVVPQVATYVPPVAPVAVVLPIVPCKTPTKKAPPVAAGRIQPQASFYGPAASQMVVASSGRNEDFAELIEAAKAGIEGYREDGPPLGFVFDRPPLSLPAAAKRKATTLEHTSALGDQEHIPQLFGKASYNINMAITT